MRNANSLGALTMLSLSLACGRTEPFGTETYGPSPPATDDPDGGELEDVGGSDRFDATPDAGPAPDARPNFPDVGFPDLGCGGCDEIVAILDGIRWESPCGGDESETTCLADRARRATYNLRGLPGAQYEAVLRLRGVVERRTYQGGYHEGGAWQLGGGPTANARNIFQLELSSPAETYFLNRTEEQEDFCHRIDERLALRFSVGTSFVATLLTRGGQFRNRGANRRPIVVGGVPPAPDAYDGQFLHMSVESIRRIR